MINYRIILGVIGLLGLLGFWSLMDSSPDCDSFIQKEKMQSYSGIITEKYIDQDQHNYHKIILSQNPGTEVVLLDGETSGLFEYLKVGDSIAKESQSLKLEIWRNAKDTVYHLDFFCLAKVAD